MSKIKEISRDELAIKLHGQGRYITKYHESVRESVLDVLTYVKDEPDLHYNIIGELVEIVENQLEKITQLEDEITINKKNQEHEKD